LFCHCIHSFTGKTSSFDVYATENKVKTDKTPIPIFFFKLELGLLTILVLTFFSLSKLKK